MGLGEGLFTAPSWQTFTVLAWGWAVAGGERQTITTYLWLTGATTVKHFSRFYPFLGGALYQARWQLWARILRCAARWAPELSGVEILSSQTHLGSFSQCVRMSRLRPGLRHEAAARKVALIEQRHEDGDPALAKDTDQA